MYYHKMRINAALKLKIPLARHGRIALDDEAQERTCFKIVGVGINSSAMKLMNLQGLEYLSRIAQHGTRVLNLLSLDSDGDPATMRAVTDTFQVLLPSETASRHRSFGVDDLTIFDSSAPNLMAPLLSAVQVCRSIQTVTLKMESGPDRLSAYDLKNRRKLWRWIAYALFSRHAQHKIHELTVDAENIRAIDFDEMRTVMTSDDPLAFLYDTVPSQYRGWIQASRFYFRRPRERQQVHNNMLDTLSPLPVRVIQGPDESTGSSTWWKVLLPGRGKAWVHPDDAIINPSDMAVGDAFPSIPLVTFRNMNNGSKDQCLSFLQALPCAVECVQFCDDYDEVEVGEWCPAVLAACPGLKNLVLPPSGYISGLKSFLDCAVAGTCRLRELAVGTSVYIEYHNVTEYFEALRDATHPMTAHLEELELAVASTAEDDEDDEEVEDDEMDSSLSVCIAAIHKMPRQNRRLHTVKLDFRDIDERRIKIDKKHVAIRTGPLAIHSKLALLSAVSTAETTGLTVGKMDSSILTIVFQFAAQHRIRQVTITFSS